MTGPLADKALFLTGSVKFFNEDYKDADSYFTPAGRAAPEQPAGAEGDRAGDHRQAT